MNFIKIEYSKHTLIIGVEWTESSDWGGPSAYTWPGELSPFVSLESLLFHLSDQPWPSHLAIFFEEHLAFHATSAKGERKPFNFTNA